MTISSDTSPPVHDPEAEYRRFLAAVAARFRSNVGSGEPLFTTDATELFATYLEGFPAGDRKYNDCHACRRFMDRFGGLVTIDALGRTEPAIWNVDDAPAPYRVAVEQLARAVRRAKVTGVFLSAEAIWGRPETPSKKGTWHHFAVTPPSSMLYARPVLTAGQAMAEKLQDHHAVARALAEFSKPLVDQALVVLRSDALYRSEKVLGQAEWLADLHAAREQAAAPHRDNVLWRAIATAPAGFCHPRASMIGTLLEDLVAGLPFEDVSRKFAAKMHPLRYQRPQAAPSAGAIAQAEKLVAELQAAGALARRFARVEDLDAIWKPAPASTPVRAGASGGVFAHLVPKTEAPRTAIELPPVTSTWVKFRETVLPLATAIEFYARSSADSYSALVTAVNSDAPPILQWDREDRRNPVSWYFWHGGAKPEQYGLQPNSWVTVSAVTHCPAHWGDRPLAHHGEFTLFVLDGARESRKPGAALFPEFLRSEFHGVRSVIEAFSRSASLEGADEASACGIALQKNQSWNHRFRVTTRDGVREYVLDRWD